MQSLPHEVRRIAREVLLALADDESMIGEDEAPPQPPGRLACCVRIDGHFRGQVWIHASVGLANRIARRMFGHVPDGPFTSESQEALREMTNIVAGNLKSILGAGNHLDLPEDLPLDAPYPDLESIAETVVDHQGERLEVRVFAEG